MTDQTEKAGRNVAIITGANGAMGEVIARGVLQNGYEVVMACRNVEKSSVVYGNLKKEFGDSVSLLCLDLASFASVCEFAEKIRKKYTRITLLLNNAGVIYPCPAKTKEGFEMTVGVNYLGHYLLSDLLLPLMGKGTRVINMLSLTYKYGKITESFFDPIEKNYRRFRSYSNSKLALLYFTLDAAEAWKEKGITVNCVDPGIVNTGMLKMGNPVVDGLCNIFYRPFTKTPEKGAETFLFAALSGEMENVTGHYLAKKKSLKIPSGILTNPQRKWLREKTEKIIREEMQRLTTTIPASL